MRILNIKVALVFLNFFLNYSIKAQPVEIHNTLKEINSCVGRISLKLIWELGGEVIEDEEQAFYIPVDIAIDRKGYIYVLDQGNNRIQLFNSNRKYIKTIGRAGKGPGEFAEPINFAFYYNNSLIISDFSNRRIQIIDSTGHYLGGFKLDRFAGEIAANAKNEIIMVNSQMISASSNALFCVYNDKGKLIRSIGENKYSYPRQRTLEGIYFDLDSQDNIYVSYYVHPQIEIYGSSGKLISKITYEVPFKVIEPASHGESGLERVAYGISIDDRGRIFIATQRRIKTDREKKVGISMGSFSEYGIENSMLAKHDVYSEKTNLYQLLVFNKIGKVIASKPLDVYCNNIKVYKDKLFIVDSFVGMKIYEYKISFE